MPMTPMPFEGFAPGGYGRWKDLARFGMPFEGGIPRQPKGPGAPPAQLPPQPATPMNRMAMLQMLMQARGMADPRRQLFRRQVY